MRDLEETQPLDVGPQLPCGKGAFVRHVSHGGAPELFADRCEWLGLRWVMLQSIWQRHEEGKTFVNDVAELPAYAVELEARGIVPFVFGWPLPDRIDQFVDVSMRAVEKLGARGIVINPEQPWRGVGEGKSAEALELVARLRAALGSLRSVGMTSYGGGPGYIAMFPWRAFSSVDFGIPQVYDMKNELGATYPAQSIRRWLEGGYDRLVPAWGASSAHTVEQMREISARTPVLDGAVCWWDLYWILQNKTRAQFVRDYVIPEVA